MLYFIYLLISKLILYSINSNIFVYILFIYLFINIKTIIIIFSVFTNVILYYYKKNRFYQYATLLKLTTLIFFDIVKFDKITYSC